MRPRLPAPLAHHPDSLTGPADSVDPQFEGRARRRLRPVLAAAVALALLLPAAAAPHREAPAQGSVTATDAARVAAATVASDGPFELTGRDSPRKPLRWLACRAIAYRINTAGMPRGMDAVVKSSMALIGRQTGVAFRYAGTTTRTFRATAQPAAPTIYFSFTPKRSAFGRTFSYPGEIGVGGPTGGWIEDGDGHLYEAITSGRVLLSTTFKGPRRGAGATWQSLIVHETGHALNLAHRPAARDAMNAVLSPRSPGRFQPAELAALHRVLQTTGCDYRDWSRL